MISDWKCWIAGIVAIIVIFFCQTKRSNYEHLQQVGKSVIVQQPESYTQYVKNGSVNGTSVDIIFVANGLNIKENRKISKEIFNDFSQGQPVKALYDPINPHRFILERDEEPLLVWVLLSGFMGFMGVYITLALWFPNNAVKIKPNKYSSALKR